MNRRVLLDLAKDWALAIGVVFVVLVAWAALQPRPPDDGPAPAFTLPDLGGNEVTLADFRGRVVVVNFWATWCGPCIEEIPEIAAFVTEHPDVPVLGISVDEGVSNARLNAFARKVGINYTVLVDERGDASDAYGVNGIPVTFIIDEDGTIGRVIHGSTSKEGLARAVAAVKDG